MNNLSDGRHEAGRAWIPRGTCDQLAARLSGVIKGDVVVEFPIYRNYVE